jgi:WD40 repeat protein
MLGWSPRGAQVAVLQGHAGLVTSASFSPDGALVVTGGLDRTARVWAVAAGTEVLVLQEHEGAVNRAIFSPDGGRIASASDDATARVWECEVCVPTTDSWPSPAQASPVS